MWTIQQLTAASANEKERGSLRFDANWRLEQITNSAPESRHDVFAVEVVLAGKKRSRASLPVDEYFFANGINYPDQRYACIEILVDLGRYPAELVVRRDNFDREVRCDGTVPRRLVGYGKSFAAYERHIWLSYFGWIVRKALITRIGAVNPP
jgi:hypothetical protein